MPIIGPDRIEDRYDLIIGGTGFGSMFFLHGFLERNPLARVLILEWGEFHDQSWQVEHQANGLIDHEATFINKTREKPWYFTLAYGGGTNCWWGNVPRLMPSDFRLKSTYGVGEDWPLGYDELEPHYVAAERIMHVAGPDDIDLVYPRSEPYPQPSHNFSTPDQLMKAAMPENHFAVPTARLRIAVDGRGPCCNSVACSFCPVDAKFTVLNTFGPLVALPNVHVVVSTRVLSVDIEAGVAKGVRYLAGGRESTVKGDLVAIGCNAIHSPHILLQSGLENPALGRYLHEKTVITFEVLLDGVDHFDGGIPTTGFNTALLEGEHRRSAAGAAIFFINHYFRDGLRPEYGRWRQTLPIEVFVEDLPQADSRVYDDGEGTPVVEFAGRSAYCERGIERVVERLPEVLSSLPVERIIRREDLPTAYHVQGTCRMGSDPATSVVDSDLVHHDIRNLLVLGTSVWPSCGTANPSLTAAALSLRSAAKLGGSKWSSS